MMMMFMLSIHPHRLTGKRSTLTEARLLPVAIEAIDNTVNHQ